MAVPSESKLTALCEIDEDGNASLLRINKDT
jgi:hypothetical protein